MLPPENPNYVYWGEKAIENKALLQISNPLETSGLKVLLYILFHRQVWGSSYHVLLHDCDDHRRKAGAF